MENSKQRVLGYQVAKVIEKDDLAEVSGGWQWSNRITGGVSGGSGQGSEAHVDLVID
jgi:hypothetical protein